MESANKTNNNTKLAEYRIFRETGKTLNVRTSTPRYAKELFESLLIYMMHCDYTVQVDKDIRRDYPAIANSHYEGFKNGVLFKANYYPAGFELNFYHYSDGIKAKKESIYQNREIDNMPYLVKLELRRTEIKLKEFLDNVGVINKSTPVFDSAYETAIYRIKNSSHYKEGIEKIGYQFPKHYHGNITDRDGKLIQNGDVKYYRDNKGRLLRGTAYYNLNNMWWLITGPKTLRNVANHSLFDITCDEDRVPKLYSRKITETARANKLRKTFSEKIGYKNLNAEDMSKLRYLLKLNYQIANKHNNGMDLKVSKEVKSHTKVLKTKGLIYSKILVDGSYFKEREAITFHKNGFIGFSGWASSENLKPINDAFESWIEYVIKRMNNQSWLNKLIT